MPPNTHIKRRSYSDGENVIAVGGQRRWADTATVIKSANTASFLDLDVQEIIAKPITKRIPRQQ